MSADAQAGLAQATLGCPITGSEQAARRPPASAVCPMSAAALTFDPFDELLRQEGMQERATSLHVNRLVFIHEGAVHSVTVAGEHRIRVVRVRRDLFERDRRRERDVISKDGLHVVVARDDPVPKLRTEKDRFAN